jgi:ketosteroid isomerase-like protein
MIVAASLACILTVSACGRGGNPAPSQGPVIADPVAAIAAEEDQWNRDYVARDLERMVARYAPDATLKEPDTPPLSGGWIRTSLQAAVNDPAFTMTFAHDRIDVAHSGDLAYSRGHYRATWTDPQSRQLTTQFGTYLTIWRKQADGHWKVQEDFMTPGPAPRPPM